MEIKLHILEELTDIRRSQKGNLTKYLETNENGITMYQNLWQAVKQP